jgi:hypothetical protein
MTIGARSLAADHGLMPRRNMGATRRGLPCIAMGVKNARRNSVSLTQKTKRRPSGRLFVVALFR